MTAAHPVHMSFMRSLRFTRDDGGDVVFIIVRIEVQTTKQPYALLLPTYFEIASHSLAMTIIIMFSSLRGVRNERRSNLTNQGGLRFISCAPAYRQAGGMTVLRLRSLRKIAMTVM